MRRFLIILLSMLSSVLAVYIAAISAVSPDISAKTIRTRLTPPSAPVTVSGERMILTSDSAGHRAILSQVVCTGFDKVATSVKESFFISNRTDRNLTGLTVRITYLTLDSMQLHRRDADIDICIPAGETRKADITSFDSQRSFHYYKSITSRRATTPFDIRMQITRAVFVSREEN